MSAFKRYAVQGCGTIEIILKNDKTFNSKDVAQINQVWYVSQKYAQSGYNEYSIYTLHCNLIFIKQSFSKRRTVECHQGIYQYVKWYKPP